MIPPGYGSVHVADPIPVREAVVQGAYDTTGPIIVGNIRFSVDVSDQLTEGGLYLAVWRGIVDGG